MSKDLKQWECRVQTIGSIFGTRDGNIEALVNEN